MPHSIILVLFYFTISSLLSSWWSGKIHRCHYFYTLFTGRNVCWSWFFQPEHFELGRLISKMVCKWFDGQHENIMLLLVVVCVILSSYYWCDVVLGLRILAAGGMAAVLLTHAILLLSSCSWVIAWWASKLSQSTTSLTHYHAFVIATVVTMIWNNMPALQLHIS